jgi:hypothetical protein
LVLFQVYEVNLSKLEHGIAHNNKAISGIIDKESADEIILTIPEKCLSNSKHFKNEVVSHPIQEERDGIDQTRIYEADYSKEIEDVLQLIVRLEIDVKSFVDPHLRMDIEAALQQSNEITQYDRAAGLQLISSIELASDFKSLVHTPESGPDRQRILQQRIRNGPFTEDHSLVLMLLCDSDHNTSLPSPLREIKASDVFEQRTRQTNHYTVHDESKLREEIVLPGERCAANLNLNLQAQKYDDKHCEVSSVLSDQVVSTEVDSLTQECKNQFFMDTISGIEVNSSLLSREERSALQLVELRAKAARIQQSLPEWVRSGMVPCRRNPSPQPAVLEKVSVKCADQHAGRDSDALQISCRADIVLLSDFLQPALAVQPKFQQDAVESLLLGVEQCVDIATNERGPSGIRSWHREQFSSGVFRLSSTPPSRTKSSLAYCLQSVLGSCCLRMFCWNGSNGLGKCPVPDHGPGD